MELHGEVWKGLEGSSMGFEDDVWFLGGCIWEIACYVKCNENCHPGMHKEYLPIPNIELNG
jgi:hypothetical protein